jgi:hypothetical protein
VKDVHSRNVIGVFGDAHSARAAVRFLEHAGFSPDHIAVVSRDVRKAREVSASRSPQGAVVGAILGAATFAMFIWLGGPVMWSNGVALALGLAGFLVAGVAIGWLTGRGRLFVADRAEAYEDAVEAGETLVSVHVSDAERARARGLLREAGAASIPEEGTVEAA